MSSVLILGAGLMQRPAVDAAHSLGFKVYVVDADPSALCVPLADVFARIDLKDKDGILAFAEKIASSEKLEAVFTAGTDFSSSVSYVCERTGLPAHSYEAALNASDKIRMRRCFSAASVPSPAFVQVCASDIDSADFAGLCARLGFPLVVKPADNMGARGCRMAESVRELSDAVRDAVRFSRTGRAVIEEFMDGPEYSIDALIYGGSMTITGFAERHINYPPYFIETGHTMPAVLPDDIHDRLISAFALGAKSLGLTCGAAKADIKFTSRGPMIGEIVGRLSGGYMSGWTYPYASGLDLTGQALLVACGREPEELLRRRTAVNFIPPDGMPAESPYQLWEVPCVRASAERAWISIPGRIGHIEGAEAAEKEMFVRNVFPRPAVCPGADIYFPRNNVEKGGNVISCSDDRESAVCAAEKAVSDIVIVLEPDVPSTDEFLSSESEFPPSAFALPPGGVSGEISGVIPAGADISDYVPSVLRGHAESVLAADWNHNSFERTVGLFMSMRPDHPELDAYGFWRALMRGGIQGALYYSDTLSLRRS